MSKKIFYIIVGIIIIAALIFVFSSKIQLGPEETVKINLPQSEVERILMNEEEFLKDRALLTEGDYLYSEKKYEEALKKYQTFLDKYPNDDFVLLRIGRCQTLLRDYESASLNFYTLIEKHPTSVNVPDALYHLAYINFQKADFEKTKEYCDKVLNEYLNLSDSQKWIPGACQTLKEMIGTEK